VLSVPSIGGHKGGAAGFKPSDISGLVLWLESDTNVSVVGGGGAGANQVTAWADQSAAHQDPAVWGGSLDTQKMFLTPNTFGTAPGLTNTTGGQLINSTTNPVGRMAPRSVYVVANPIACTDGSFLITFRPDTGQGGRSFACTVWNFGNGGIIYPWTDTVANSSSCANPPSDFEGANHIFSYQFDGTNIVQFFMDGTNIPLSGAFPQFENNTQDGFHLGSGDHSSGFGSFPGALGAYLVYDSFLGSGADDAAVRAYLKHKYSTV
jgi:hypothetical protein